MEANVKSFQSGGFGPGSSISDSVARSLGSIRQVSTVQSS